MSSANNPDGAAGRILIVEDDLDLRRLFREQLERFSPYSVMVASDGVEGLEVIEAESPDLVLLNLNLPHLDGREVARRAREHDADLAIVIVSGYDLADGIDDALVDDYLLKPISAETLVGAAEDHLPATPVGMNAELEQQ